MASNAPNTESAADRAQTAKLDGDATMASLAGIDSVETADAPKRGWKARGSSEDGTRKSASKASKEPKSKRNASAKRTAAKVAANKAANATAKPSTKVAKNNERLGREALLELDAVRRLIEVGEEKGEVNRDDLTTAFDDKTLGREDLDGVLSVLREHDIPLARTAASEAEDEAPRRLEPAKTRAGEDAAGSADPVRVYLREGREDTNTPCL